MIIEILIRLEDFSDDMFYVITGGFVKLPSFALTRYIYIPRVKNINAILTFKKEYFLVMIDGGYMFLEKWIIIFSIYSKTILSE